MSGPCPPPPPPRARAVRAHSSCLLCKLTPDDVVLVMCTNHMPYEGTVAELTTAGITLNAQHSLVYFPWSSVLNLQWQPVGIPDDAQTPK